MANNLGRNIAEGEIIVLSASVLMPKYHALEHRVLIAKSGYGLANFTAGRAVYSVGLFDREDTRWNGDQIDKAETEELQAKIQALNLTNFDNALAFLQATDNAQWAIDVLRCAEILRDRAV